MSDKNSDRSITGKNKEQEKGGRTGLDIAPGHAPSGESKASKRAELDRQLTILGFPDGRPLWAMQSKSNSRTKPATALGEGNRGQRMNLNELAGAFNDEFWDVVKSKEANFVPTLEADHRDWSPFVIKANYHAWARCVASEYGLEDHSPPNDSAHRGRELNAFRHAATAAIFALKYGPKTALLLGTINELISESGAVIQGNMNENEIADCNADLLNNRAGIQIASTLLDNTRGKEQLTLKAVTDEVVQELKSGRLVTQPLESWRSGTIAPELKLLLGKPADY
jgi:hypothetical protein